MECIKCSRTIINSVRCDKTKPWFIKGFRKFRSLTILHAGLIVSFINVPFVNCDSASTLSAKRLTYEEIFNTTNYVQINNRIRPLVPSNSSILVTSDKYNYAKDNYLEEFKFKDKYEISSHNQLLIGFARDPYRLSIPEADYLNGVRNIDPSLMNKGDRGKRGVVHLYNMLTCATGCDPISYKGYGCYCGFLGSGRPTDPIDNCCRLHDECYENVYCPFYTVYFQPYYWKCYQGEPLCALENYRSRHQFINGCAGKLCDCDRRFAMCVRKYHCPRKRPLCKSSPLRLLQNLLMSK